MKNESSSVVDVMPKSWPRWVRHGLRKLELAEQIAGESFLSDDLPEWVVNMMMELWRVVGPNVCINNADLDGPTTLAAFVGHIEVLTMSEEAGLKKVADAIAKKERELNQKIIGTLTKQQLARWINEQKKQKQAISELKAKVIMWAEVFEGIGKKKLKVCQSIIATAGKQRFTERMAFFDEYARSLKRKYFAEDGQFYREKPTHERIVPSTIYTLMIFNWETVDAFKNFGELRRWLEKKFGRDSVGDVDRLKHLCQRHGYDPEGITGRPAGTTGETEATVPTVLSNYILMSDVLQEAKATIK